MKYVICHKIKFNKVTITDLSPRHTHIHTHACTYTHARMHVRAHAHTHMHIMHGTAKHTKYHCCSPMHTHTNTQPHPGSPPHQERRGSWGCGTWSSADQRGSHLADTAAMSSGSRWGPPTSLGSPSSSDQPLDRSPQALQSNTPMSVAQFNPVKSSMVEPCCRQHTPYQSFSLYLFFLLFILFLFLCRHDLQRRRNTRRLH